MAEAEHETDGEDGVNGRMCIVSRRSLPAEALIRFVAAPDGAVVPDLKRRLPGRGAHVELKRDAVDLAVKRRLFGRALKREVTAAETLGADLDALLARSALGALGLARKARQLVTGASKVDAAIRSGKAIAVLHAVDGAADGVRKMDAARRAAVASGAGATPAYRSFTAAEMGLALGGENVIHAAVLAGDAGSACLKRLEALESYRGESSDATTLDGGAGDADRNHVASDMMAEPTSHEAPGTDERCGIDPAQEAEA
nr:RNA-binding protein [Mangrovicella endophytica]